MAWPATSWYGEPWTGLGTINAFLGAVVERHAAAHNGASPGFGLWTPGIDAQRAAFGYLRLCQEWVEAQLGHFVVSHVSGTPLAAGAYDGEISIPQYATLAEVFSAAGLSTSDWRRYQVHPDDGGLDLGGKHDPADIKGEWLFEDLQKVLNVLVWTLALMVWTSDGEDDGNGGNGAAATWGDATSAADADWASGANLYDAGSVWPLATADGVCILPDYAASIARIAAYGQAEGVWTGVARAIDWYTQAAAYGVWEDFGDPVTNDGTWALWLTESLADPAEDPVSSATLGDLSNKPTHTAQPGDGEHLQKGWGIVSSAAVVRWNVAGGFEYR